MKFIATYLVLFSAHFLMGQTDYELEFIPTFNGETLDLNQSYYDEYAQDSVVFSKLKLYISNIELGTAGEKQLIYDYFLFDGEQENIIKTSIANIDSIESIHFTMGVDSLTNAAGAKGGALDPIHGMYWAWQSGYINFKLEGSSPICNSRTNEFNYHVGGFLGPHNTERKIELDIDQKSDHLIVYIAIDEFLNLQNLQDEHTLMSPGAEAMIMADQIKEIFSIKK